MSERDEIPADIWETAHYAVGYDTFKQAAIFGTAVMDSRVVEIVARAILAERRRCAGIARSNDAFPQEGDFIAGLIEAPSSA